MDAPATDISAPARLAREGDARWLAAALAEARRDTLARFDDWQRALPALQVPRRDTLNPPLWELGHVGWFQEWWIARNHQRHLGWRADPDTLRLPPLREGADALYDSAHVAHAARWSLALPEPAASCQDLASQLERTLGLLHHAEGSDDSLYFFRLALLHEDMHHEAALYMAHALGVPMATADARWQPRALPGPPPPLALPAGTWSLGREADAPGFAFDNECGHALVPLPGTTIDAQVLRWQDYLPFVEDGGYESPTWWTPEGWAWRQAHGERPAFEAQDPREAACHLSLHEALAWCRWAGRRLPTEAEWECAALTLGDAFRWGDAWEWTATAFRPWPGFAPHPYRAYSAPWFDGRPVLRGASFMTQPRMRHPRYRNFFTGDRTDVATGFRTCAA
jgi:ergothioneine biosynthesis protein EgtB